VRSSVWCRRYRGGAVARRRGGNRLPVGIDDVFDLGAGTDEKRPAVFILGSLTDLAVPGCLAANEQPGGATVVDAYTTPERRTEVGLMRSAWTLEVY
jgi:hypothetical protein